MQQEMYNMFVVYGVRAYKQNENYNRPSVFISQERRNIKITSKNLHSISMKPKYAFPYGYLSESLYCSMSSVHEQLFPVICPRAALSQLFGCKTVPTESMVSSRSPEAAFSRDLPTPTRTPPTASSAPLVY